VAIIKNCQWCQIEFPAARKDARFCCDKCRWSEHADKAYAMKRNETLNDINAVLDPDPKPRKKGGGLAAKRKGERGEREVTEIINKITGEGVKRKLGQAREGGGDADWGPFLLEIKNRTTVSMPEWQRQVCEAVKDTGQVPAVVWKRKGGQWWCAVPFEEFVQIFNTLRLAAMASIEAQNESGGAPRT